MNRISIKLKVTLWFTAALLLMTALAIGIMLPISGTVRQSSSHQRLMSLVEHSVRFIEIENGLLTVDSDFMAYIDGIHLLVYAEDRAVLAGALPPGLTIDEPFEDAVLRQVSRDDARFYVYDRMVALPGFPVLWVRGCAAVEIFDSATLLTAGLIILPLLALTAVLGGYALTRRVFHPVAMLQKTAEEINDGNDLSRRLVVDPGSDELHRLVDTFNDMFSRLEAAFETERQFVADASHELRTPLTVIISQCEYALQQESKDESAEALSVILRNAVKMQKLIEALLTLARMEQGIEALPMQKLNLSEMLSRLCDEFSLSQGGVTIGRDFEPDLIIQGSSDLLTSLSLNLLRNAICYGKPNGIIEVSLRREGDCAVLRVKDDGIGIPEQHIERIWDKFYQADPSRTSGMGLGLSIVRSIAKLHGGAVSAKSKEGEGSEFSVHLPLI